MSMLRILAIASLAAISFAVAPLSAADPIEAVSGRVIDLGSTPVGSPVTATVTFANPSAEVEMPIGFSAGDPGFEVVAPPEVLAPGERVEFPITLTATVPGEYETMVRIYRELAPEADEDPMIAIAVKGVVTP